MSKMNRRNFLRSSATLSAASLARVTDNGRRQSFSKGQSGENGPFKPYWNFLRNIPKNTPMAPRWEGRNLHPLGIYSCPAYGKNGTWYAHNVYTIPNSDDYKHHVETYRSPLQKFGFKDFIPCSLAALLIPMSGQFFSGMLALVLLARSRNTMTALPCGTRNFPSGTLRRWAQNAM